MLRFEYTCHHEYTCRDCQRAYSCSFAKHGNDLNRLPCIDSILTPKKPKLVDAAWDYMQLKRQVTTMLCIVRTEKHTYLREDFLPESFKTEIHLERPTFTEYCIFEVVLKAYWDFLIENEVFGDNNNFMTDMIWTQILLVDGKVTVISPNKKLKDWIRKDAHEKGYKYREEKTDVKKNEKAKVVS